MFSADVLVKLYIKEIVRLLHGVLMPIVSERDMRFTSRIYQSLKATMGTTLNFSTNYHPQSDDQFKRTIQRLADMYKACILDFKGSWDKRLPLVEFTYNNKYHSTI